VTGRRLLHSNGDITFGVFSGICDQLADDKAERDAKRGRQFNIRAGNHYGAPSSFLQQQVRKVAAQVLNILLELNVSLMVEEMQPRPAYIRPVACPGTKYTVGALGACCSTRMTNLRLLESGPLFI